ncbi:MAG: YbbR-like domain-containing protein [Deltaproteobacteria bacterium]|nr:YbbR-like domain-containing protein [Deltaproteobacteria bacterium]
MTRKRGLKARLRALVLDNLWLKIVSVIFALGFYGFTHGAENIQRTVSVPVIAKMPPKSAKRRLMTQIPQAVRVTVGGSGPVLDRLKGEDLGEVQLNLMAAQDIPVEIESSMLTVPPGVVVERIEPSWLDLRWEDEITRRIPIQVPRSGEPEPGVEVKGTTRLDPPEVTATGPASELKVIQFARTEESFDITGLREGEHRRTLALARPPGRAGEVVYEPTTVVATVSIGRKLLTKEFAKLKVEVVGAPRAVAKPDVVNVRVTGAPADIEPLTSESVIPRVEPKISGADLAQPGSMMLDVLVTAPDAEVEVRPPKVLVKW